MTSLLSTSNDVMDNFSFAACFARRAVSFATISYVINTSLFATRFARPLRSNCKNLKGLCLHRNQLTTVPESVWGCDALEELYIDGNKVVDVGEGMGNLTLLKELGLQDNLIIELPSTIGNLKYMHTFHLENNKLAEIPKSFGKLKSLRRLYINGNELTKLHACVGRCDKLEIINVENNKIEKMAKVSWTPWTPPSRLASLLAAPLTPRLKPSGLRTYPSFASFF